HHNRHYNITSSESQQRPNRRLLPINIEVINYRDGNVAELVALGNVSVTTATEWLFLRHPLVLSYHQLDLLDAGILSEKQSDAMIGHLKEGEFLGPLGVYSISKADRIHWDIEDVDWGGGGQ